MENLKISWPLSPSTIIEKRQVFASVNGAAATQIGADLPSSASEVLASFPADVTIQVYTVVTGDNGSTAQSPTSDPFVVKDMQTVVADGKPSIQWLSHTD